MKAAGKVVIMMGKVGKTALFFWLIGMLCHADSPETRIVIPPTDSALYSRSVEIICSASADVSSVTIEVSGKAKPDRGVCTVQSGYVRFATRVSPGRHVIKLRDADGRKLAVSTIYILKKGESPPSGFKKYYVHSGKQMDAQCTACHGESNGRLNPTKLNPVSTCTTSGCHAAKIQHRFVHGPVGAGTCIYCHDPHGSFYSDFLSRQGSELCTVCHEDTNTFSDHSDVHSPVADGSCTECHDPHGSETRFQLKAKTIGDLCFHCHAKDEYQIGKSVHDPVLESQCTLCHNPHASNNENLLIRAGNDLCAGCHEDIGDQLKKAEVHPPAEDNCLECHSAHKSAFAGLLKKSPGELCVVCHENATPEMVESMQTSKVPHKPVKDGQCTACHLPHGSDFDHLLPTTQSKLCTTCHIDIKTQLARAKFKHGPVAENDCIACHQPHGSNFHYILNTNFPKSFYVSYDPEKYALCFECHNSDIAETRTTTTLTNFRNGDLNLHYLHVNKHPKGRSCKACHEVHAGTQPKHIRTQTPFGKWSYPIEFKQSKNGGTCQVGCHRPLEYNRLEPVKYD